MTRTLALHTCAAYRDKSAGSLLCDPDHVAARVAERAVTHAIGLVGRLLQHLGPARADLLEGAVEVAATEDDPLQGAFGEQLHQCVAVGFGVTCMRLDQDDL